MLLVSLSARRPSWLALLAAVSVLTTAASAQCGSEWQDGAPAPGPYGSVHAVLPLPSGQVVAGGSFRVADGAVANNVALWDGTTWHNMGTGINGLVSCLARLPNGDVVAGGTFLTAGGVACNRIARWNGTTWSPLASGVSGAVQCLLVLPTGELVAGGAFEFAGSTAVNRIAVWNGSTWSPLGAGVGQGAVNAIGRLGNGDLIAGGGFVLGVGLLATGLQQWNGTSWQVVPGFDTTMDATVTDLAVRTNGDVVVTGDFFLNGLAETLAVWNGSAIQPLAPPFPIPPSWSAGLALLAASNGDVVVGGFISWNRMARWDGTSWQPITDGPAMMLALAEDATGGIVAGAQTFQTYPNPPTVQRFNGGWQVLGAGTPPTIGAMTMLPDGDVVVGGMFQALEGVAANHIARWNGIAWSPLGLGLDGRVTALTTAPNGDVIVCGFFAHAGGAPAQNVARWNGSTWSTLGAGVALPTSNAAGIAAVAVAGNGDVLAAMPGGGAMRFDGLQWTWMVFPGPLAQPQAMVTRPNGDVLIGGVFDGVGPVLGGLLQYSGGTLTPVAGAPGFVSALFVADDGAVIVRGSTLQRWDGAAWTTLPAVSGTRIGQLANGDLIACGTVLGAAPPSCLSRLRASGWESFGELTGGTATRVIGTRRGEVLVGGTFQTGGSLVSLGLARSSPTCPAATVPVGAGCSGGAGPVALFAERDAWVGGTLRATATGMTANSLAVQAFGVQALSVPLPPPLGAAGCSLLLAPLLTDVLLPSGGTAASSLAIPNQPSLAGQQLLLQVIGVELGTAGIVRLTSTNALQVTIGAL